MIIGVSGKARSGKDTFFNIYQSRGFVKASFAAELKSRVRRDFGLTVEHTDGTLKETPLAELNNKSPRELLIEYGNMFRKYNEDYWCKALFDLLDQTKGNFIITDVRYPNEAKFIKDRGGLLIRLERHPSRDNMVDEKTKQSVSETALDNFDGFDTTVPAEFNQTPADLEEFAKMLDESLVVEQGESKTVED